MSQDTYDVRVKLVTGEEIIIENATNYGFNSESGYVIVEKNGYTTFITCHSIIYIGRDQDLKKS